VRSTFLLHENHGRRSEIRCRTKNLRGASASSRPQAKSETVCRKRRRRLRESVVTIVSAMENESTENAPAVENISAAKFLQDVPPGEARELTKEAFKYDVRGYPSFRWPAIELYCANEKCGGFRFADPSVSTVDFSASKQEKYAWCDYSCRNCQSHLKLYGIAISSPPGRTLCGSALKIGECPLFGPHLPARVTELLGNDADYFLKGHRAESQGLGIAAFAYYRRVVENQRTHIFDEIISAAEHVGAEAAMIERPKYLRDHWRFQQSIDELKGSLPQILLIEGQNPLELLHPVLSDSIHDRSDEEALEIAAEIRLVLINLAERIALAKTQSDELKKAVEKLAARKAKRGEAKSKP